MGHVNRTIEWCVADGMVYVVQSRPITTLFPIPDLGDGKNHVFLSLSHQQLMTDVMRPLGMSMFQMWFGKLAGRPTVGAGGRLYLDVSRELASPIGAKTFIKTGLGSTDMLIQKALASLLDRKEFIRTLPHSWATGVTGGTPGQIMSGMRQAASIYRHNDPDLLNVLRRPGSARWRRRGCRSDAGLPRQVRDARARRDRHHPNLTAWCSPPRWTANSPRATSAGRPARPDRRGQDPAEQATATIAAR
jgi:hypothetical protein